GDPEVLIGSADLMPRNLDRRVEVLAPVKDRALRDRLAAILDTYLADNLKSREMLTDGSYVRVVPSGDEPEISSQGVFLGQ
ncbi:MAG: RNA degradosome polyphosphate kinase, partial [Actinobacteria bacterium]